MSQFRLDHQKAHVDTLLLTLQYNDREGNLDCDVFVSISFVFSDCEMHLGTGDLCRGANRFIHHSANRVSGRMHCPCDGRRIERAGADETSSCA